MLPDKESTVHRPRGRPRLLGRGTISQPQQRGSFYLSRIQVMLAGTLTLLLWLTMQFGWTDPSAVLDTTRTRNVGALSPINGGHHRFTTSPMTQWQTTSHSDPKILPPLHAGDLYKMASESVTMSKQKLRYDWSNMTLTSDLAKRMLQHQRNCKLPLANLHRWNLSGLGSDLHIWSQALCNAMQDRVRLRSSFPWVWLDQHACDATQASRSSMLCYFPESELLCPDDEMHTTLAVSRNVSNPLRGKCRTIMKQYNKSDFRAASSEFLFRHVSRTVIDEAERQLHLVFPDGVPEKLITVHMRWGDKQREMKLQSVDDYVQGVHRILEKRGEPNHEQAHIFLSTEDPKAVAAFQNTVPKGWKIFIDQYYHEMLPLREEGDLYNQGPKTSKETEGHAGLVALGSLLVAMEADYYVLTTASNWSRLMNELRKNTLDPRCNGCTLMEDLHYGEY